MSRPEDGRVGDAAPIRQAKGRLYERPVGAPCGALSWWWIQVAVVVVAWRTGSWWGLGGVGWELEGVVGVGDEVEGGR